MDSNHEARLFYTAVCSLSKGNVVESAFELRDQLKTFLEMQGKHDFLIHFIDQFMFDPEKCLFIRHLRSVKQIKFETPE